MMTTSIQTAVETTPTQSRPTPQSTI